MRHIPLILLALLACRPALADWTPEQRDVRIPMRDGQWLAADVFLPRAPGRYPTILVQTPYDKNRLGAVMPRGGGRMGWVERERYAYVGVDWRGFFGSRAAKVARANRGHDGYDTVEWIARQPWSNGKVGTWGGSALGKQQFETARAQPPHLVCAVPMIAAMGTDYRDYYAGGVLLEAHTRTLDRLGFGVGAMVRRFPHAHQLIWSIARKRSYQPERIGVPMLLVTGWWDNYPARVIETFSDLVAKGATGPARLRSTLLIGPWDHMSIGKRDQGALAFPGAVTQATEAYRLFFDHWLYGKTDNGWKDWPRLRYYQLGEDRWIDADGWPGQAVQATAWRLHGDGRIAPGAPAGDAAADRSYRTDPADPSPTLGGANLPPLGHGPLRQAAVEKRADVLVYSSDPLTRPLRLAGQVAVDVAFTADRVDADLIVRLCWVKPDGVSVLIGDAAQRARLRDGRPANLVPGRRSRVTVRLPPVAWTVPAGHRLRLILSSTCSPRYERNTHDGSDHWDETRALALTLRVHHDAEGGSRVVLPVVPGGGD